MAPTLPSSKADSTSTRPRLQAINQDFSDLDEQVRQAAHIIGLPDDWHTIEEQGARADIIRNLVRARAEWVLRWILDKLKDEADAGKKARRHATAWQLLEWMILVLPVSRSAPHLRDAGLPTILERALLENFDPASNAESAPSGDVVMEDAPESVDNESQPSRKRKRGSLDAGSSNQSTLERSDLGRLFHVITCTVSTILKLATASDRTVDSTQIELMKMVLRTESAQASRILRFWLTGVNLLLESTSVSSVSSSTLEALLDLSYVVDIWDLRNLDAKDEGGASSDEFSTECLMPTLTLLEKLRSLHGATSNQVSLSAIDQATQTLDKLLAKHLFAPSRAVFFNAKAEPTKSGASLPETKTLAGNLGPLRAKFSQAMQIEDSGETVPAELASLPNTVSHLLDLAIRASPSRTPKGRLVEKPWIQATFGSLIECAGCSLEAPPEFVTGKTTSSTLEGALHILQAHNVNISADLLKTIFWYYSGVKYPKGDGRQVHWSLIAALVELDSSIFVVEPKSITTSSQDSDTDIAELIFDQISAAELEGPDFIDNERLARSDAKRGQSAPDVELSGGSRKEIILERIIIPLMSAFVRNRNLLGFFRRWDTQLIKSYRQKVESVLRSRPYRVWEDRSLNKALAEVFEQSLTQSQITGLLEEHAARMSELGAALDTGADEALNVHKLAGYRRATSSTIIITAILQSIKSNENLGAVQTHLHSLFVSYASWVQDDRFSHHTKLSHSWLALCQLLAKLWPIELHSSPDMQQELLHPLLERASNDMTATGNRKSERRVNSSARAAAMMFLLNACNCLQTVPGSESTSQAGLQALLDNMSSKRLEPKEYAQVVEFFCTYFVDLCGCFDAKSCEASLYSILSKLSQLDDERRNNLSSSLSHSIINEGSSSLKTAYYTTLSKTLSRNDGSRLHDMSVKALTYINPLALSREQREAVLNQIIELIDSKPSATTELLSIATQLMEVPNATAKISTDSEVIFVIAENLHKHGQESPTALQLLRKLVQLVLSHLIPNEDQAQNKTFFKSFVEKLDVISTASTKCSAARLSILRATIHIQKQTTLLDPLQYVELLKHRLADGELGEAASLLEILDAFNELPQANLETHHILKTTRAWLRIWINDNSDLESYMASSGESPVELIDYVVRLHTAAAKFKLYPNAEWLFKLTNRIVHEPLSDSVRATVYEAVKTAISPLPLSEKLDLLPIMTDSSDAKARATKFRILSILVGTLDDTVEADADLKQKQLALLPNFCVLLSEATDYECFNILLNSINTILNDKPSLASQYSIECLLSVLTKLTSRHSPVISAQHASSIFSRLCETSRLILLLHRGRLGGRFHILLPLLQGLLFCLFIPNSTRSGALPSWLRTYTATAPIRLTPTNATQFSRLLSTLCNPPQSSITKAHQHHTSRKSKDLNDPIKAARERASHFLYPLLASFCRFQLAGRLEGEVREKLMPGMWEVVGTAGLHQEALEAMFAGLGRSERDVWRGIWGEWEGVHGRKQIIVAE